MREDRLRRSLKTRKGLTGLALILVNLIQPIRWLFELVSDAQILRQFYPAILIGLRHLRSVIFHPLFSLATVLIGVALILWSIEETPATQKDRSSLALSEKQETRASESSRIFVSSTLAPVDLMNLCKDKTSVDAQKAIQPYIGKWMNTSGSISNILPLESFGQFVTFQIGPVSLIYMCFDKTWAEHISILQKGQTITV